MLDAHVALLTTCTYTLFLVAVNAEVDKEVAVVLGAPWLTAFDVPGVASLVINHSYVVAAVEPEPVAVAVKTNG